jgi:hypothetical protein
LRASLSAKIRRAFSTKHRNKSDRHHATKPKPVARDQKYTCPMHPEIVRDGPGSCPICGMALEPLTVSLDQEENPELKDMTRRFWIAVVLAFRCCARNE